MRRKGQRIRRLVLIAFGVTAIAMVVMSFIISGIHQPDPSDSGTRPLTASAKANRLQSQPPKAPVPARRPPPSTPPRHAKAAGATVPLPDPPVLATEGRAVPPSSSLPLDDALDAIVSSNAALLRQTPGRPASVTLVSGIWNIGRGGMHTSDRWVVQRRPFSYYVDGLKQFLKYNIPKVLFCDADTYATIKPLIDDGLENGDDRVRVFIKSLAEVRAEFGLAEAVNALRFDPKWLAQSDQVANSAAALLADHNPLVMSKLRFTRDAARWNPFGTDGFLWVDGTVG